MTELLKNLEIEVSITIKQKTTWSDTDTLAQANRSQTGTVARDKRDMLGRTQDLVSACMDEVRLTLANSLVMQDTHGAAKEETPNA